MPGPDGDCRHPDLVGAGPQGPTFYQSWIWTGTRLPWRCTGCCCCCRSRSSGLQHKFKQDEGHKTIKHGVKVETYTAMADRRLHERSSVQFWEGKLTCPLRRTSVHRNCYSLPVQTEKTQVYYYSSTHQHLELDGEAVKAATNCIHYADWELEWCASDCPAALPQAAWAPWRLQHWGHTCQFRTSAGCTHSDQGFPSLGYWKLWEPASKDKAGNMLS